MDLSSLQKDLWPKGRMALDAIRADHTLSPRAARLLRDVTLLLAIVVLLFGLRPIAASIKRSRNPSPFDLVMKRFSDVHKGDSLEQVRNLLGSPDYQANPTILLQSDDFRHFELPARDWQAWTDPRDQRKWVAIHFVEGKVSYKTKSGF